MAFTDRRTNTHGFGPVGSREKPAKWNLAGLLRAHSIYLQGVPEVTKAFGEGDRLM